MRILLTGKDGQLGWELTRTLSTLDAIIAVGRDEMNLEDPDAIVRTIREVKPDLIVNAAAYTAVDRAETDEARAHAVNAEAPGIMAGEAARSGAAIIHYSTDYVFDGTKASPYTEEDAPNPLSVYGRTKLDGEHAIAAAGVPHLILRTSWVYGSHGGNFLKTVLRLAAERDVLRIVDDQTGAPTWTRRIAMTTSLLLASLSPSELRDQLQTSARGGIYHLTASGITTWYGFARALLESSALPLGRPVLEPIKTSEYPTAAVRPAWSVLSNGKLQREFGILQSPWESDLADCISTLTSAVSAS